MPGPIFKTGDRVALHTVEREDLDVFARARNDPDVRVPLAIDAPQSQDAIEEFYEETISAKESVHLLAVVDGDPVGATALFDADPSSGAGDLAYWVLPEFQGNGYAKEALSLLLEYAFEELRLHRVQADLVATNDASRGLLESLQFTREGRFRDDEFQDGEYVDVLRYGLLAEEWRDA